MTFPKKGTRTIKHKGETYHWRFGRSDKSGVGFILIEKTMSKGRVLSIQYPTDIVDLYLDFSEPLDVISNKNYRPATPKMISCFIQQALNLGWKCDVPAKTLKLVADENDKLTLIAS